MNIDNIENLEEMEIGSQALKDNNWTVIKRYRCKNSKGRYDYYALISCRICGHQELIKTSRMQSPKIVCKGCTDPVGQIFGCYKVLELDHIEQRRNRNISYYKVECIKCGRIYIKEFNKAQWKQYSRCKYCNSINGEFGLTTLLHDYRYSAKERNLEWKLTTSEFVSLVTSSCHYCGSEPSNRKLGNYVIEVNGIDRVDSSKGYVLNNCVPCCSKCNYMKLDLTREDFLEHISKIYNHNREGSTTIENVSEQSTSQANGDGNGKDPEVVMDQEIV